MRVRSAAALTALAIAAIVAVVLAMTRGDAGGTPAGDAPTSGSIRYTPPGDSRVSVVVIGDSISQGDSQAFNDADTGRTSWAHHLDKGSVRFVGGVAEGGMTSKEALNRRLDGFYADVVVYFLGTNDLRRGITPKQFLTNVTRHAAKANSSGIPGRVVVVGVGPMEGLQTRAQLTAWNKAVRSGAVAQGFSYVDPWQELRTSRFEWRSDTLHRDEIHPTAEGAVLLGDALSTGIVTAYEDHPKP